jgi:hypothetical protein
MDKRQQQFLAEISSRSKSPPHGGHYEQGYTTNFASHSSKDDLRSGLHPTSDLQTNIAIHEFPNDELSGSRTYQV